LARQNDGLLRAELTARRDQARRLASRELSHLSLLVDDPAAPLYSAGEAADEAAGMYTAIVRGVERAVYVGHADALGGLLGAEQQVTVAQPEPFVGSLLGAHPRHL